MKTNVVINSSMDEVFPMSDMKPCEVCVIVEGNDGYYVMRTASERQFEVMALSPKPRADMCWTGLTGNIKVRRLRKGERITLTFEGE